MSSDINGTVLAIQGNAVETGTIGAAGAGGSTGGTGLNVNGGVGRFGYLYIDLLMKCPICSCQDGDFKVFEDNCIFVKIEGIDQHLIRHQCPSCDIIFGPQQMLNLTKEELGLAYKKLFDTGHRDDGRATVGCEVDNLLSLNPTTDGIYLNWGSQASMAPEKVRALGYKLFNYEPFMTDNLSSDYMSTEQVNNQKFDGIISHNC